MFDNEQAHQYPIGLNLIQFIRHGLAPARLENMIVKTYCEND